MVVFFISAKFCVIFVTKGVRARREALSRHCSVFLLGWARLGWAGLPGLAGLGWVLFV